MLRVRLLKVSEPFPHRTFRLAPVSRVSCFRRKGFPLVSDPNRGVVDAKTAMWIFTNVRLQAEISKRRPLSKRFEANVSIHVVKFASERS